MMTLLGHVARLDYRLGSRARCALGLLCEVTTLRRSSFSQNTHRCAQSQDMECGVQK